MGCLIINKISYIGDKYFYTSPELKEGLQIIEASNGAGKTTFSAFVCYGLGMYIKQFDFKKKINIHQEVYNDKNNYIQLDIILNGERYQLNRYFHSQTNTIFIKYSDGSVFSYPIYRNKDEETFSDWILTKLGIEVCEIYQGTSKFKINFSDLFRLIHYDQDTSPNKIYKEHRQDGNFISDSTTIRKVIFELLIGHQFSDYYLMLGEINKLEKQRDTNKATLDSYIDMSQKMGFDLLNTSLQTLVEDLTNYNDQIRKLNFYREELKQKKLTSTNLSHQIQTLRTELIEVENKYTADIVKKNRVSMELNDLLQLKEDLILEVTQIRKIILSHQELMLFSPNTCPCCLREITRKDNHCICGLPTEENQYEKFFYNIDEYLEILKSKQKSVETIEKAITSCKEELEYLVQKLTNIELEKTKILSNLTEIEKDIKLNSNNSELNFVSDKIVQIQKKVQEVEHKKKLYEKYDELENNYVSKKNEYTSLNDKIKNKEKEVQILLTEQITIFNESYTQSLHEADSRVSTAELNEDYMPIINGGIYMQASSNVAKRFIYFLTLLKLSIENYNTPFPKFLLIDTPENLGIDKENLDKCLSRIIKLEQTEEMENNPKTKELTQFQIILTTGIDKYPKDFKKYLIETLTDDNKLLKEFKE